MYMHIVYIQYTLCEVLNEVPTPASVQFLLFSAESETESVYLFCCRRRCDDIYSNAFVMRLYL